MVGLLQRQQREEITLVFVRIRTAQNHRRAIGQHPLPRVVTRRHKLKPLAQRVVEKHAEFHLAIAPHIRVGRDASAIAVNQVIDDPVPVAVDEIKHPEFDPKHLGHCHGLLNILLPWAITGNAFLVDPVLHVTTGHLVALLD